MKSYRPWSPNQSFLLPPSPLEWLPEGHLAYFVLDTVQALDLSAIEDAIQDKDGRGERPYCPAMMVALLVYGYSVGVFSSRRLARETYEDVAFRVLAGGEHPHFTTVNQFRLDHREALAKLFVQVLRLCKKAGLVKLGHVSFDGTKVAANASKHKAMSYKRMQEEEKRLEGEVKALLGKADEVDRSEDAQYGVGQSAEDLPQELQRREARLARIREAKAALEQEAAEARAEELRERAQELRRKAADESVALGKRREAAGRAATAEKKARALDGKGPDDEGPGGGGITGGDLPRHRVQTRADGTPTPKAQRNFTDPESRIMVKGGEFLQAYNAQAAVDAEAQIIVAALVTNQPTDAEHLAPMLDEVAANCGQTPVVATADSGYFSRDNAEECARRGVDAYISVGRGERHLAPAEENATPAQQARAAMAARLATSEGKAIYARRKCIVEPAFGQVKQARGFRRFSFRGLLAVRAEWAFVCATHNLLKLFRSGPRPLVAAAAA
ncbi:MAG: IS1182 family transposase [Myxococcales bacterium]